MTIHFLLRFLRKSKFFSPSPAQSEDAVGILQQKGESLSMPVRDRLLLCVVLLGLNFMLAVPGFAQSESATVSGRVTDSQERVVPQAQIQLVSVDTNVASTTKTNSDGLFVIPNVRPGKYRMLVVKDGFKEIVKTGLTLNVQDSVVENFSLQVGSISESVTVTAGQSNMNITDATVSTVVDQSYIANMPLNGRSFQDLILLTPGIVTNSPQSSSSIGVSGEFSVNGQRTESNYYTVDGVSANVGGATYSNGPSGGSPSGSLPASSALGTTQGLASVDSLQEFRVQSSTYSAEYGRNPGGQFAFETKAGANQWHGSAFEYLRNDFFDANDWFNGYYGLKEPPLRQNDFGGTLGGPVRIPHLYNGKDKTFFFVSYEGLRLTSPQAASVSYVPSLALRASAPAALTQALNAFPIPNGLDTGFGATEYIATWSNPSQINSTSVRLDHTVNNKTNLFFRFSATDSNSKLRVLGAPNVLETTTFTLRTYTAGVNSFITDQVANELRFNYSSNEVADGYVSDSFGGAVPVNLAQMGGLNPSDAASLNLFLGPYSSFLLQESTWAAYRQWNLVDTLSAAKGRHKLKFGLDYRRLTPAFLNQSSSKQIGGWNFQSESAVDQNTAEAISQGHIPVFPLYTNFSAFVQDEYHASARLSLSLGLRWDVNPSPGVTQGVKPYTTEGSDPNTVIVAPEGTPLWHTAWFNFAPRVGAAYLVRNTPGSETVIRAGGGVFFDTGQQTGSLAFADGLGTNSRSALASVSFPVLPPVPPIVPPVPPYQNEGLVISYAPHLQLPYTWQWNTSVEQALGRMQTVTVSYVGSRASRLLQQNQINPANNPNLNFYLSVQNGGTSDYNSLQVQFQRRLSAGLTALASYTFSHCLDYGSSNFNFAYQRGNCDFDVRHNFSAALSYDTPAVGGDAFLKAVLNHWGLDDRFTARTGFPLTLSGNQLLQPSGQVYDGGLDIVPGQPIYLYGSNCTITLQGLGDLAPGQGCPGGRAINPNAFVAVNDGLGNAPRNFARGFGAIQMDLAIRREFPIHERLKLQFRAEAFNIFNHPNFGSINSGFCSGPGCTFGQATATLANSLGVLSPLYQMGGPRSMQFALKLLF
jgi:hypothetical protein